MKFNVNYNDLNTLRRLIKRSPDKMRRVTSKILNDMAFATRTEAIKNIKKNMIVKNERFISSSIFVGRANPSAPIETQKSSVGALARPRFSGLVEQELGTQTKRTRVASLAARGGTKRGIIKRGYRMDRLSGIPKSSDYPGKNDNHRTIVMLIILNRRRYKKPFIVQKHKHLRPGVYKFFRRRVKMLQAFRPKNLQPARKPWLEPAYNHTVNTIGMQGLWARSLRRYFK